MRQFEDVVRDKGSKYAVSGAPVADRDAAKAFLRALKRNKKYGRATHNSWAVLFRSGRGELVPVKNDDGEGGAGNVILRNLMREGLEGHIIVVTRWYGGVKLGGDRFRHVQRCVRHYLDHWRLIDE
ncbi:MAG: YigZ family protein [Marinosulfonomonas sp.]|nr:YigZ family protein [Marinosulfonomonas sp.]